jgi:hypothetical protein
MSQEANKSDLHTIFWMRVAAITFGLWSAALPIGAMLISNSINDIQTAISDLAKQYRRYELAMENRVTVLEQRSLEAISKVNRLEMQIERQHGKK